MKKDEEKHLKYYEHVIGMYIVKTILILRSHSKYFYAKHEENMTGAYLQDYPMFRCWASEKHYISYRSI